MLPRLLRGPSIAAPQLSAPLLLLLLLIPGVCILYREDTRGQIVRANPMPEGAWKGSNVKISLCKLGRARKAPVGVTEHARGAIFVRSR